MKTEKRGRKFPFLCFWAEKGIFPAHRLLLEYKQYIMTNVQKERKR